MLFVKNRLRRPATAPGTRTIVALPSFEGYDNNPNTVDRVLETALRLARQFGTAPDEET